MTTRIKQALKDKGMTQAELAHICELDQGYLNRVINGKYKPNVVTALRIATALGRPVEELFEFEEETVA